MVPPSGAYVDAPHCESLCTNAEAVCKREVRINFTCGNTEIAAEVSFDKKGCEVAYGNSPLTKTCKANIEATGKSKRGDLGEARDTGLNDCEGWGATCEATCSNP